MKDISIAIQPEPGIAGLDELAEALGIEEYTGGDGVVLEGRSGKGYSLVELLQAHIRLMRAALGPTT